MFRRLLPSRYPLCVVSFFTVLLVTTPSFATWPSSGLLLRSTGSIESMVADGNGGVYCVLLDDPVFVVQHVSANGDLLLGPEGFVAGNASSIGDAIPDGAGGIFIPHSNNSTVRVARVTIDPVPASVLWNIAVCSAAVSPIDVECGSDGAGGVVAAWSDKRSLGSQNLQYKTFAQRVDGNGAVQWQSDGVLVMSYSENDPRGGTVYLDARAAGVVCRGPGESNVICAYNDLFSGFFVFSSRLDANGGSVGTETLSVSWSEGNVISDNAGGAFMAQAGHIDRFSPSGRVWWNSNPGTGGGYVVLDGAGGALHIWQVQSGGIKEMRCQRYTSSGGELWTPGGVLVASDTPWPYQDALAADPAGGAWLAWADTRSGNRDIYYQHLDQGGAALLPAGGLPVRVDPAEESNPRLVSFADGHAIVSWNTVASVWVQRLDPTLLAVSITTFSVRAGADRVQLDAEFRSDLVVRQVNVYRGDDSGAMRLLATVVPSDAARFEYVDASVAGGTSYRYQIGVVDADGEFLSPVESVSIPRLEPWLAQNRPNPFNPGTTISVTLPARSHATLTVYDMAGRRVRTLADGVFGSGSREFTWDGRDDRGAAVASGVYFYRLRAGTFTATRRMVLLK
jgi:hypothetical protein